jgi:alkaline phosphatase D
MKVPLHDVTSSGLTHTWPVVRTEDNPDRVGDLVVKRNFGLIRIDWKGNTPTLSVEIWGHDEGPYAVYRLFE